jgi:tetrapyrrole methylase family protein/MazG family protein/ATP diphosphatase
MGAPFEVPAALPLDEQRGQTFPRLVELMQRLLAPDGCPWDREQDFSTLRRYVLEEACEVIDAIDGGDRQELTDELGDLALQVVFLAELGRKERRFGPDDAIRSIIDKLVRRHPHVFADVDVKGSEEVLRNWERIKAEEKRDKALLDGIPRSLPALYRAQRMSEKVSRVGFDWPDGRGSRDKVTEELGELDEAIASEDRARVEHELGDMLFALVNLARHQQIDAETALRNASERFRTRFDHVERRVRETHGGWPASGSLPLAELDGYWDEAKRSS